jgi:predicted AlkP superfamily phosphohydrolase/phosphomutase
MRTGPCWSSILTGWDIETHKITHLLGMPKDGSNWFGGMPECYIFDELGKNGYSVGVVNFPSLYKARRVKGWMIGGWPEKPDIWPNQHRLPDNLYSDLPDYEKRGIPHLKPSPKAGADWATHELPWRDYIDFVKTNLEIRFDVIRQLPPVDVLMIQESVMDRAGHMLSTRNKGKRGALDPRYQRALEIVDLIIGKLLEHNPDYFAVVSDHGFYNTDKETLIGHSHFGVWSLYGEGVTVCKNSTDQVNFTPTILDALGIVVTRDGRSILIKDSEMDNANEMLKGLGYV